MLKDITIGQYYPTDSFIHRLDPRTKLIMTFLYIIILFMVGNFAGFGVAVVLLGITIKVSKVPLGFIIKGLKSIFVIMIFALFLNVFFIKTGTQIIEWPVVITTGGVYQAAFMATRLILLIIGSSLMTLTTSPIQLTDGLEHLLAPLKKIKVPAHEIAMMMTIALRFIPILLEETDKIMKAQMARGADFESGGIMKKAKSLVPLLVPLFISAFRRADDLAMAMEARCYRGDVNRTRMKQLAYTRRDAIAYGFMAVMACTVYITSRLPLY